jgi:hypothetical protein
MIASIAIMLYLFSEGDSRFRRAQLSAPQTIALYLRAIHVFGALS